MVCYPAQRNVLAGNQRGTTTTLVVLLWLHIMWFSRTQQHSSRYTSGGTAPGFEPARFVLPGGPIWAPGGVGQGVCPWLAVLLVTLQG
jgi:hypothetical protein